MLSPLLRPFPLLRQVAQVGGVDARRRSRTPARPRRRTTGSRSRAPRASARTCARCESTRGRARRRRSTGRRPGRRRERRRPPRGGAASRPSPRGCTARPRPRRSGRAARAGRSSSRSSRAPCACARRGSASPPRAPSRGGPPSPSAARAPPRAPSSRRRARAEVRGCGGAWGRRPRAAAPAIGPRARPRANSREWPNVRRSPDVSAPVGFRQWARSRSWCGAARWSRPGTESTRSRGETARSSSRRATARLVSFLRSSSKPIQALPLVRARDDLDRASSRSRAPRTSAEPRSSTPCGGCSPTAPARERELECGIQEGRPPDPLHHNCSGKHAGMLALCRARGWRSEGYRHGAHRVQRAMAAAHAEAAGVDEDSMPTAVDGCGVVTFALSLERTADAFSAARGASRRRADRRGDDASTPSWSAGPARPTPS